MCDSVIFAEMINRSDALHKGSSHQWKQPAELTIIHGLHLPKVLL
jgi:hypothetical protein